MGETPDLAAPADGNMEMKYFRVEEAFIGNRSVNCEGMECDEGYSAITMILIFEASFLTWSQRCHLSLLAISLTSKRSEREVASKIC